MPLLLRLYEDVFAGNAEASFPALPRFNFVVHGVVTMANRALRDDDDGHQRRAALVHDLWGAPRRSDAQKRPLDDVDGRVPGEPLGRFAPAPREESQRPGIR